MLPGRLRLALALLMPHLLFLHGVLHLLHIPELLPHMTGRPCYGYEEIKYEPVQQVEDDRQEEYFG